MSGLKQRIIGALVLISLAVIFVPMMFDQPHDEREVRSLDIPEEPPFPEVSVPEEGGRTDEVPDYRVEEVEPAPAPEVVEDPAMGTQPTEAAPPPEQQVPLVGEGQPEAGEASAEARQPETAGQPADDEAGEDLSAGDQASDEEPAESEPEGDGGNESADFERSLEGAWVLQLGSFGDEENARRLRDRVRDEGYGAHLQEFERGDQRLVRVFSGPFTEKAEAEKAKKALDEAFGVQSLVTRGKD
ncbi:MAG: SPOR domain-containing protein [Marinobacter sp.]